MTAVADLPEAWQPTGEPVRAKRIEDKATGNRWYIWPPTGEQLISVTTVLSETEGKPYLVAWSARLAAEYAVDNLAALAALAEAEGRKAAVDLAKQQAERIRDIKRDAGSYVHDVVEKLILWAASPDGTGTDIALPLLPEHLEGADYDDDPIEDVIDWMIEGFLNFVADFKPVFQAAEMAVYNQPLGIAGTLDMIATLPGLAVGPAGRFVAAPGRSVTPCIDVKTGKHLSVTWREQVAAYRRMRRCLLPQGELAPMPVTDCATVLHLRPEHERGYRLMLISGPDDEAAWQTFLWALYTHGARGKAKAKPGKVVYPLRADGTIQLPRLADLDGEGYGRTLSPLIKAGIADLEQLAAMKPGDLLAMKGVGAKTVTGARALLADHGLCLRGEELAGVLNAIRDSATGPGVSDHASA